MLHAGHVWAQSMIKVQTLSIPENWGSKFKNYELIPHLIDFPEAAVAIKGLIKFACKPEKGYRGQCECAQSQLLYTYLCVCKGQCERKQT